MKIAGPFINALPHGRSIQPETITHREKIQFLIYDISFSAMKKIKLSKPILFETPYSKCSAEYLLGEGGSGKVFEARDETGHRWAIKYLDPRKASKEKNKRFKNEIIFCLKSKHPNIVTVFDYGIRKDRDGKSPFYVMPIYDSSLRDLLRAKIPSHKVLKYFYQILDGVETAHSQGVIHRDLKPENIFYAADSDRLLIADFGTAYFAEEDLCGTVPVKAHAPLAIFPYAAPEQRTPGSKVTNQADIYAIGLILNEMFTGEVPFGTKFKTIAQASPGHEDLDALVGKMISPSPQGRPGSIADVRIRLSAKETIRLRKNVDHGHGS
jgi:serine/threonine protein kinase